MEFKELYILDSDQIKDVHPSEINIFYDEDKPKGTLVNLMDIKSIYDRRNIRNEKLETEISNFKSKVREERFSILLDKNAAK